jgi:hypothetical protein
VSELFSGVNVANVDLQERDGNSCESIAKSHACVCETARVDDDELGLATGVVDSVDDGTFMVGLKVLDFDSQVFALRFGGSHDIGKRGAAVHLRLSCAQEVEVGAVNEED